MPSCGGWRRASGNLSPSTCPKLSPTNSCLACALGGPEIEITAIATSALEYNAPKYAVKFGAPEYGAIRYGALGYDTLDFGALKFGANYGVKFGAFENGALRYGTLAFGALDNGTLEYGALVDDVKANGRYTVPRPHEPSREKFSTAGLIRKMTFGTTKDLGAIATPWTKGRRGRRPRTWPSPSRLGSPGGELVKSRDFRTHDLEEIEMFVTRHPVLNSQLCIA